MTHQVVQCGQRRKVVLQVRRSPERIPLRSLLLNQPNHRSRKPPTRGQPDPVGEQVQNQPHTGWNLPHGAPHEKVRAGLVERSQLTGPVAHPLMVVTLRIGQHRPQLGVARRPTAVLRRANSFAVHTTRLIGTRPKKLDVVSPPVTEVVQIDEPLRQAPQPRTGLVHLVVRPLLVRHAVADAAGDELVQVAVGPPDRHLQQLVQLGQRARRRHVDHTQHPRSDLAQRHPQPNGPHRPTLPSRRVAELATSGTSSSPI